MRFPNARKAAKMLMSGLFLLFFPRLAVANPSEDVKQLLVRHIQAAVQEKKEDYLSTWDPTCTAYTRQAALIDQSIKSFDLHYALEEYKLISSSEKKAEALAVVCSKKISGPSFRDNRVWQILQFNHTSDGWKICSGKILQIQYFDGFEHVESSVKPLCRPSIK